MPGYQERLRNLDNIRLLMRDFLIYGFHTRNNQKLSSSRTYDNERHRIESLLGDTLQWRQSDGGRQYFISAESAALDANPLHRIYRLRTFTDNDLMLHCCLLAELDTENGMTADELTDAISNETEFLPDVQAVRRKLQEYAYLGIAREEKDGKRRVYTLSDTDFEKLFPDDTGVEECLSFYREFLPVGCVADSLMLRQGYENQFIRFKHHFLMHTLDDEILLSLLESMHDQKAVRLTCDRQRIDAEQYQTMLLPVCIRISEETGRRYLIGYDLDKQHSRTLRLDLIRSVETTDSPQNVHECIAHVRDDLSKCWGISMPDNLETHHVQMDVRIDLPKESFVRDRLIREGRGGTVTRIDWNLFRYEIDVADTTEMMRWIRTFTGRIVSLKDDDGQVDTRFQEDMERMRRMYGVEVTKDGTL